MTIGLVAIVRNEERTICRCLSTAAPLIDHWTICDTGSTDTTEQITKSFLKDTPGEYLHHDWSDFGTNRTMALKAAHGTADWLLMLDADQTIEGHLPNLPDGPNIGMISIRSADDTFAYRLPRLLRDDRDYTYHGVTHEYLEPTGQEFNVPDLTIRNHDDGSSRADKFQRDLDLLSQAVLEDPLDARSVFYLARTHDDLGNWQQAAHFYRQRTDMNGWADERFYAHYRLGCLLAEHHSYTDGARELIEAFAAQPWRAEPLRALANAANHIADQMEPPEGLFVHRDQYGAR